MILDAYAAFLTAASIPFSTMNGFSVCIHDFLIAITVSRCGTVTISDYIGLVNYDLQRAQALCDEMTTLYPGYRVYTEKYSDYYEIEVERTFSYTGVPALHEEVTRLAEMISQCYALGKQRIEGFHR